MKTVGGAFLLLAAAAAGAFAQHWEFGVAGGYSLAPSIPVTATQPAGTATTGFAPGGAFSVYLGENVGRFVGGELRYSYIMGDARIQSGGASTTFNAVSHEVHYDLILHTSNKSRVQLFAALGGGVKIYDGTGVPMAYQPLMQYAYLTQTHTLKPMGSVGGGIKYAIARKVLLRMEFRDYITSFPTEVITPALGATFSRNILHNFVPMAGLSFGF
jgi:hypothetical protein